MNEEQNIPLLLPHIDHTRLYQTNKFVYPVLSRRSKGISVGINLNPDKVCNFDCIYCEVDRRSEAITKFVEIDRLIVELEAMLNLVESGSLFQEPMFAPVPPHLRRLNDIAFSGDGEPTTFRNIDTIVEQVALLKQRRNLDDVKLVMITNASVFQRPAVKRALAILDQNNGEIWAKLDAGTDAYYHLIERTAIPFQRILDNLRDAAMLRPIVIQSLFMKVDGKPPTGEEILAYCDRLSEILAAGGSIKSVQVYTVARKPAESSVGPLDPAEVESIAALVGSRVGVSAEAYAGAAVG